MVTYYVAFLNRYDDSDLCDFCFFIKYKNLKVLLLNEYGIK